MVINQREIRGNGYIIFRNSSSKLHCPPTKELNGGHQPLKYQGHRIVSHDRSLRYDVAGVNYRYLERLGEKVFSLMRQIQITTTELSQTSIAQHSLHQIGNLSVC